MTFDTPNILRVLATAVALTTAGLGTAACQESPPAMTEPSAEINEIAQVTGVRLPEGADVVFLVQDGRGDPRLRAKVLMSQEKFEAMLAENGWAASDFSPTNRNFLGLDEGEWQPRSGEPFPVLSRKPADGEFLYVGGAPDPAGVLVYLLWFRT